MSDGAVYTSDGKVYASNEDQEENIYQGEPSEYTNLGSDFNKGLCECCDDCNLCLCSFCCPCVQFGDTVERLRRREDRTDTVRRMLPLGGQPFNCLIYAFLCL